MSADDIVTYWPFAKQVLSTMRQPAAWFPWIRERIDLDGEELFRDVQIALAPKAARSHRKQTDDIVHVVLLKPRKGLVIDVEIHDDSRDVRILTHDEHRGLTGTLLVYRFTDVIYRAYKAGLIASEKAIELVDGAETFAEQIAHEPDARLARNGVHSYFNRGWLKAIPRSSLRRPAGAKLAAHMNRLFRLATETSAHYYKFARIENFSRASGVVRYTYSQSLEDRSTGLLRRALRATTSYFYIHTPLARQTSHYEFSLAPIPGYYVFEQRALAQSNEGTATPVMHAPPPLGAGPWTSRQEGRSSAPRLFIGAGHTSKRRLYVGLRLLEVPPGSSAQALTVHLVSLTLAVGLVVWSLTHYDSSAGDVASVLLGILSLSSVGSERLLRRAAVLNAPLLPRAALFSQAILLAVLAIWLVGRGSASDHTVLYDGWMRVAAGVVTDHNWVIGVGVVAILVLQTGALTWRWIQSTLNYHVRALPTHQQITPRPVSPRASRISRRGKVSP